MIRIGIPHSADSGNGPGCPVRAVRRDRACEDMFGTVPNRIAAPTAVYARFDPETCEKMNVHPRRDHTTVTVVGVSFPVGRDRILSPHRTASGDGWFHAATTVPSLMTSTPMRAIKCSLGRRLERINPKTEENRNERERNLDRPHPYGDGPRAVA